jgi:fibronectin type 3 domain-containing protein
MTTLIKNLKYIAIIITIAMLGACGGGGGASQTTATAVPDSPSNITGTAGNAQALIHWTAANNSAGYRLFRSTTSGGPYTLIITTSNTAYTDTGLANGTVYYYIASAYNNAGQSSPTAQISVTPDISIATPQIPTGFVASAGDGQVTLLWNTVNNATSYVIQRSTSASGPYSSLQVVTNSTYNDTNLQNGNTYFYIVASMGPTGQSANSQVVSAIPTQVLTAPLPPTLINAVPGNGSVSLSWTASTNAISYTIYRTNSRGANYSILAQTGTNPYTDTTVGIGSTYYYVISASNNAGTSAYSSEVNATPLSQISTPPAPSGINATAGDGQVTISWTSSAGASSYSISRSTNSTGPFISIGNLAFTSYIDTSVANGMTYYYAVTAISSAGISPPSAIVNSTPIAVPLAPTGVTATPGDSQIALNWDPAVGANNYKVLRSRLRSSGFTQIVSTSSTSFNDTSASNGLTYYYQVIATGQSGPSAVSATIGQAPGIALAGCARINIPANRTPLNGFNGSPAPQIGPFVHSNNITNVDISIPGPNDLGIASMSEQPWAACGYLDVTRQPFSADPTGVTPSDGAFRNALQYALRYEMVVLVPSGNYLVQNPITCSQTKGSNVQACALTGIGPTHPVLFLDSTSTAFASTASTPNPPMLSFNTVVSAASLPGSSYDQTADSSSYNQTIEHIDLNLGSLSGMTLQGNHTAARYQNAVGIWLQGAQGTGVMDSVINATNAQAGLRGGSGSGGSHADITVKGGNIGLWLDESQPSPTISGITLSEQTGPAIYYGGVSTLTAVGVNIQATSSPAIMVVPASAVGRPLARSPISLIDSQISFTSPGDNVAINSRGSNSSRSGSSSVYVNNLFVSNVSKVLSSSDGTVIQPGNSNPGWYRINELASPAVQLPYVATTSLTQNVSYTYDTNAWVNGAEQSGPITSTPATASPPNNLITQHQAAYALPDQNGVINVMNPNYPLNRGLTAAKGDCSGNDYVALQGAINYAQQNGNLKVFLPKGFYCVGTTLKLGGQTVLFGIAKHLSIVVATTELGTSPTAPAPLVTTVDDQNASTMLMSISLQPVWSLRSTTAMVWKAGRNSVVRNVFARANIDSYGSLTTTSELTQPSVLITGSGGGRWFRYFDYQGSTGSANNEGALMGPNYRHLKVDGTTQPLMFYHLNLEHANSDANLEFQNSSNINVYGLKSEYNSNVLWIRGDDGTTRSSNINVYGYGGNASAYPLNASYPTGFMQYMPSLFRVENTSALRLVNLMDSENCCTTTVGDISSPVDPTKWTILLTLQNNGVPATPPTACDTTHRSNCYLSPANSQNSFSATRPVLYSIP